MAQRANYGLRMIKLLVGLLLFGGGSYLTIQANIGLAPWEAFGMGVSGSTGMLYGDVIVTSGLVVLALDLILKERIGLGTVLDMLLVGKIVDLLRWLEPLPKIENFWLGLAVLLAGQFLISVGSVFYIGAGFSCGPRDSLMMAINKRLPKVPIGVIRGTIEGIVLLIGWLLGAKIGIGTVIAVFGIGLILQFTFKLFRFDAKSVPQEDIVTTAKGIFKH